MDKIRPIIVCENDEIATIIEDRLAQEDTTLMIAARPWIPDNLLKTPKYQRDELNVSLYVTNIKQIATIEESKYWRNNPTRAKGVQYEQIPPPTQITRKYWCA